MTAYYNDNEPDAAHVLDCLQREGLIAPGVVDNRSIKEVQPDDLKGFTQCHFFAGAGLWSVAARLAGWPDERPIWTGSCPCQPFSAAGKGLGTDDPRHLWPDFFRLIRTARPPVVMGEQVAGAPGYGWFDGVAADLESEDYAARSIDIPACAVDAPQIRQRQWWIGVANSSGARWDATSYAGVHRQTQGERAWNGEPERLSAAFGGVAASYSARLALGSIETNEPGAIRHERQAAVANDDRSVRRSTGSDLADSDEPFWRLGNQQPAGQQQVHEQNAGACVRTGARNGSTWAGAEWILCHDGKARRTEPGLRLLVDGMAGRIPAWRLGGNSISPILAAEVIAALLDIEQDMGAFA
ncbi:DNA cytosine methyltransferase [Labrys sp. KB_33_2]|uniref:DNA cytosine methyltransferase n=1 Tax=Labrys sp. KB_33_2 TaxID=3237479 RepID=UPI003F905C8E